MTTADPVAEIARAQRALGLQDWFVEYDAAEPDDDDCAATVYPVYGRKVATIRVSSEWFGYDEPKRRQVIAHELIHLHLHPVEAAADMAATKGLNPDAYALWRQQFVLLVEYAVDGLAMAVAPLMPPEVDE